MLSQVEALELEGLADLAAANGPDDVERWRIAYLGSKGRLRAALAGLKDVEPARRPALGQRLNEAKRRLEEAFDARRASLAQARPRSAPLIDVTEPGLIETRALGRRHPVLRVRDELVEVFARMGFAVATGPELEDDEHNFVKLNIPEGHPARDPGESFYVDDPAGPRPRMLRSQTSTVQVRVLEEAVMRGTGPPVRVVSPGRVYRPDTVDATHSFMFHQIEGLHVGEGVSMADLKTTLFHFARACFTPDADVRFRPSYFPFTEPSAEFDMKLRLREDLPLRWMELGGCGMVHPAVLGACGVDPERWTGYAFGFGIERLAMVRFGVPDIRMFFDNDLRFLSRL